MEIDDLKKRWQSQDRKIGEILRINQRLQLRAEFAGSRGWVRWFRVGAVAEILMALVCLVWTGAFIRAHFEEPRFLVPAAALHLWLVSAIGIAIARYVRAGFIDYSAPVLAIQRQIEDLRIFSARSLQLLFVFGCAVWGAPFSIVASRGLFGIDLFAALGMPLVSMILIVSTVLGFAVVKVCKFYVKRSNSSSWISKSAQALSGYSLSAASDQLLTIESFERES